MTRLYFPQNAPTIRYITRDSDDATRYRNERDQCYVEREACRTNLKAFETEIGELKEVIQHTKTAIEMNELLISKLRLFNEEGTVDLERLSNIDQALFDCKDALNRRPPTVIPGADEHLDKMELRRRALETVFEAIDEYGINNRDELEALLMREDSLSSTDARFLRGLERLAGLVVQASDPPPFSPTLESPVSPVESPLSPVESPLSPVESPVSPHIESPLKPLESAVAQTPWNCKTVVINELPRGWHIHKVTGDGSCQFRCIATCLYSDTEKHFEVRTKIMDYIESQWESFSPFVEGEWSDYIIRMRRKYEYGDHLTLAAAAGLYNVNFVSFKQDSGRVNVTCTRPESGGPVNAEFWFYLDGVAEHYDVLKRS